MIKLTLLNNNEIVRLNPKHIVCYYKDTEGTFVSSTSHSLYVKEDPKQIDKLLNQAYYFVPSNPPNDFL